MSTDPRRPPDTAFWSRQYWLEHCEGYRASTRDGQIGFVEEVVRAPATEEPAALAIRRSAGDRGLVVVPIANVVELKPNTEEIALQAGPDVA
jgi:hypothetical protein